MWVSLTAAKEDEESLACSGLMCFGWSSCSLFFGDEVCASVELGEESSERPVGEIGSKTDG